MDDLDPHLNLPNSFSAGKDRFLAPGDKKGEVEWSRGRGGLVGRVWRWRSGEEL